MAILLGDLCGDLPVLRTLGRSVHHPCFSARPTVAMFVVRSRLGGAFVRLTYRSLAEFPTVRFTLSIYPLLTFCNENSWLYSLASFSILFSHFFASLAQLVIDYERLHEISNSLWPETLRSVLGDGRALIIPSDRDSRTTPPDRQCL